MSYSQYEKIVHVNQPTLLQQNTSYSNLDSKRSSELSKFSDIYKSFNSTRKSNDTYEKNKKESLQNDFITLQNDLLENIDARINTLKKSDLNQSDYTIKSSKDMSKFNVGEKYYIEEAPVRFVNFSNDSFGIPLSGKFDINTYNDLNRQTLELPNKDLVTDRLSDISPLSNMDAKLSSDLLYSSYSSMRGRKSGELEIIDKTYKSFIPVDKLDYIKNNTFNAQVYQETKQINSRL